MPIDYTKRPAAGPPPAAPTPPPLPPAQPGGRVLLTKSAPTVSLTKNSSTSGTLRVNLNWDARPQAGAGFFKRAAPALDLDLGCLWEFADGTKGVVQALGRAFFAHPKDLRDPIIWLDGDDRSGSVAGGENLFVDLRHADRIKRVLVFALIYEGAANWAAANGVVTLYPASGPEVEVRLDDPRDGARVCAVAILENVRGELLVRREVNYLNGGQRALDEAYGWGMRWAAGRK
jgi:tellurite resistance protein TerA